MRSKCARIPPRRAAITRSSPPNSPSGPGARSRLIPEVSSAPAALLARATAGLLIALAKDPPTEYALGSARPQVPPAPWPRGLRSDRPGRAGDVAARGEQEHRLKCDSRGHEVTSPSSRRSAPWQLMSFQQGCCCEPRPRHATALRSVSQSSSRPSRRHPAYLLRARRRTRRRRHRSQVSRRPPGPSIRRASNDEAPSAAACAAEGGWAGGACSSHFQFTARRRVRSRDRDRS